MISPSDLARDRRGYVSPRCWALTKAGRPCRIVPLSGRALCYHHERVGVACFGGPLDGKRLRITHTWQWRIAVYPQGEGLNLTALQKHEDLVASDLGLYVLKLVPPVGVGPRFCWREQATSRPRADVRVQREPRR